MKIGEVYGLFDEVDGIPNDKLLKSISTTGKSIFIVFNKQYDRWYNGWGPIADFVVLIKYKKINLDCQNWLINNKTILMSPDNHNKTDCSWLITSNFGSYIILSFTFIELESGEYIKIYDGGSEYADLVKNMTGIHKQISISVPGNQIFVKFETNSEETNSIETGFRAFIQRIDDKCQYWKNLEDMTLSSPNYPKWSPGDGTGCDWQISAPEGYIIALEFNHFGLYYAFVILYDGICDETKTLDTPLGDILSGKMPNNTKWVVSSSGRHMLVRLNVGVVFSDPGFQAKIHYGN